MKGISFFKYILFLAVIVEIIGCKKDNETFQFKVLSRITNGNSDVVQDIDKIPSVNGDSVSVSNIRFYISQIVLERSDGTLFQIPGVHYLDPYEGKNLIVCDKVPVGLYTKMHFMLGVPEEKNITNGLENNVENTNMQWPDNMGGGYHFIKLEGIRRQGKGYALHCGAPINQEVISIDIHLNANKGSVEMIQNLNLDVYKFFQGWNFDSHKGAIMGDSVEMKSCMLLLKNSFHAN